MTIHFGIGKITIQNKNKNKNKNNNNNNNKSDQKDLLSCLDT